jgi:hypothetical protein
MKIIMAAKAVLPVFLIAEFIENNILDPETGLPFKLLDAEKEFLKYALQLDDDGRLVYPHLISAMTAAALKTVRQRRSCTAWRWIFRIDHLAKFAAIRCCR